MRIASHLLPDPITLLVLSHKKESKLKHNFKIALKRDTYAVILCQDFPECQCYITIFKKRPD